MSQGARKISSDRRLAEAERPAPDTARLFAAAQAARLRAGWDAWRRDNSLKVDWRAALIAIVGGLLLAPLAYQLPLMGYDLEVCFRAPGNPCGQMPWVAMLARFLVRWDLRTELAILNGLMGMTVAVTVAREAKDLRGRLLAVALAIVSPPVFILAWTGQIDALGLLGMLLMPFGLPLLLTKPHIYGWALLSRKWWLLIALVLLLLSFIVWGWWIPSVIEQPGPSRSESPIAMGWDKVGVHVLVVGLVMLFFSNRDPYRLIAAGTLVTPYLQPYHLVALLPALGRVSGWRRWALWGAAWLSGTATIYWVYHMVTVPNFDIWSWSHGWEPAFLPYARHLGLIFPILTWWWLRPEEPGVRVES